MNQVTPELITDPAAFDRVEWNELAARSPTRTVFQTHEWNVAWWKTFQGAGREPLVVCVRSATALEAVAPLVIDRPARGPAVLRFLGHREADYVDFLYDPAREEVLHEVLAFLRDRRPTWDRAELANLPASSPTVAFFLRHGPRHGLHPLVTHTTPCPRLQIAGHEAEVEGIRAKKSLRRHHNHFRKQEGYQVRHLQGAADIAGHLDAFFAQHEARWQETPTPSLFRDPAIRAFYRNLVAEAPDRGWLLFTVVEANGAPIAFHFGFSFQGTLVWYKPSFDPALARRSPGEALLKELLDHAAATGHAVFDFTVGDEPFKQRFSNALHQNVSLAVYPRYATWVVRRAALALKTALKRQAWGRRLIARLRHRRAGSKSPSG